MKNLLIVSTVFAAVTAILVAVLLPAPGNAQRNLPTIFKVGNHVTAGGMSLAQGQPFLSPVFEIIEVNGEWLHLKLDREKTNSQFTQGYLSMLKGIAQSDDPDTPIPTDEEMMEEMGPVSKIMQMGLYSQTPLPEQTWINVQAYSGMWSRVE